MKTLLLALLLSPPALHPEADLVRWVPESEAVELARKSSKPILYDLTAAWCPPCRLQEKQVFNDPEHAAWINKSLIPVRVVDRMREDRQNPMRIQQLQQKYKLKGFPTLVVDMPSKSFFGNSKWKSKAGYKNPGDTMQFLRDSIDTLILGEPGGGGRNPVPGVATFSGWGKPRAGLKFNLYFSGTPGGGYKKANPAPFDSGYFSIQNLEAGKRYFFVLSAVYELDGKSEEHLVSSEFSLEAGSDRGSEFSWVWLDGWEKAGPGLTRNIYLADTDKPGNQKMNQVPVSGPEFALPMLSPGKKYVVMVTSSVEKGGKTEATTKSIEFTALGGIQRLTVKDAPRSQQSGWILVSGWGKPAEGQSFNLYMAETSGKGFKKINPQPIREMNFLMRNLEAGKTYYFILTTVVQANGKLEESRPSQEWKSIANAGAPPK